MKVRSINVGLPRSVQWRGRTVATAIYKEPVSGPVALRPLNLEGDQQADLSAHGGPAKVVYAYPAEHYEFWRSELPGMELEWGMFGENLTTEGLDEESVHIGDVFQLGSARIVVTQPRMPCFKLTIRFGREDMAHRFFHSQRPGIYFGVVQEGTIEAGDQFELLSTDPQRLAVADVLRLRTTDRDNAELLTKAVATPALPAGWRSRFNRQLERVGATGI